MLITSIPINNSQYVCSDGISSDGGVYRILVASEYANLFVCIHMSHIQYIQKTINSNAMYKHNLLILLCKVER